MTTLFNPERPLPLSTAALVGPTPAAAGAPLPASTRAARARRLAPGTAPLLGHGFGHGLGYGRSFASFGEIVQGRRVSGEDFLITLPVDLWSQCTLRCEVVPGASRVFAARAKSRAVARRLLAHLGRERGLAAGLQVHLAITSEIPVGKGLSSSTADMLAVVRAMAAAFGIRLSAAAISRLFTAIEPHDGLHYPGCVAYDHRRGRLLRHLGYIPDYRIVGVDAGGEVSTLGYNRNLRFSPAEVAAYDRLYAAALAAFAARDDVAIAACATRATWLHVQRTGNPLLARLLQWHDAPGVLGVLSTHSGTCGALLLAGADAAAAARLGEEVAALGPRIFTRTLSRCDSARCDSARFDRAWCDSACARGRVPGG